MYKYSSDFEKFLNDYLENNPQENRERLKNREVLWDVKLNLEEQKGFVKAEVKRKPYMYQSYDCK